jgi:uncharacterized cupin superfamily protein
MTITLATATSARGPVTGRLSAGHSGVRAFGINLVDIPPGGQVPEHDETDRDQQEVFSVLSGKPTMVVDGDEHAAPVATFVRLDPQHARTLCNYSDEPASVLIASAPRSSRHEPMEWA